MLNSINEAKLKSVLTGLYHENECVNALTEDEAEGLAKYLSDNNVVVPTRCTKCGYFQQYGQSEEFDGQCTHPEHPHETYFNAYCSCGVSNVQAYNIVRVLITKNCYISDEEKHALIEYIKYKFKIDG